jgi:hypothetical protein
MSGADPATTPATHYRLQPITPSTIVLELKEERMKWQFLKPIDRKSGTQDLRVSCTCSFC